MSRFLTGPGVMLQERIPFTWINWEEIVIECQGFVLILRLNLERKRATGRGRRWIESAAGEHRKCIMRQRLLNGRNFRNGGTVDKKWRRRRERSINYIWELIRWSTSLFSFRWIRKGSQLKFPESTEGNSLPPIQLLSNVLGSNCIELVKKGISTFKRAMK